MYICICRAVTDRQVRRAVDQGARNLQEVQKRLPIADCCGRCGPVASELIRDCAADADTPLEAAFCPGAVFAR